MVICVARNLSGLFVGAPRSSLRCSLQETLLALLRLGYSDALCTSWKPNQMVHVCFCLS